MTIKQLMDGVKVNWIQVTIIEQVTACKYIVADTTGIAAMEVPEEFSKYIEVGKGVKLVKPGKHGEDFIACDKRFNPMKTKSMKLGKQDQKKINSLKELLASTVKNHDDTTFKDIQNAHDNTIINKVVVYVTTVSRPIESKYGCYRICNLRDASSDSMAINMYSPHVDKLEANEVYVIQKLKKITMKTDGTTRLVTNKQSQIQKGVQEERDKFKNVNIADKMVQGCCVMFTNMSSYNACSKHLTKVDQYLTCLGCEKTLGKDEMITDFHCMLQIEDNEESTMKSILAFRRLLNVDVQDMNEQEIDEIIEKNMVGKILRIDYNTVREDDDVAVKVTVIN